MILWKMVKYADLEVGEKKIIDSHPEIENDLNDCLSDYTAGCPQHETVRYTHLSPLKIAEKLFAKGYEKLSTYLIRQWLKLFGFCKRSMNRNIPLGQTPLRNEQFEYIALLKEEFRKRGLPILSIDTKKKELLGTFYRSGSYYSNTQINVHDHDFPSYAKGKVIPHGIYDITTNRGYLSLGTTHDTSEFVCDNLEFFWIEHLQYQYPNADTILLLCDGGGSNNCRHYLFKQDLFLLAQKLDLKIVVAHYPTYCSKWNPIEHRLFSQISRAWDGLVFENIQIVKQHAEQTSTKTGLEVIARINDKNYKTGRKPDLSFKENINQFVSFAQVIPKWNYWCSPKGKS